MCLCTGVLRLVHVRDEVLDPALVMELVGAAACTFVTQHDPQTAGEESRLAQALE